MPFPERMMTNLSRRRFLQVTGATGLGLALGGSRLASPAHAQAGPLSVVVDASQDLGPSRMAEVLGCHGPGARHFRPSDPVYAAWLRTGVTNWRGIFTYDDTGAFGIRVYRKNGRIRIDFRGFDNVMRYSVPGTPLFNISTMPRDLSSQPRDEKNYWKYGPRDLDEWYDVVRRTVRGISTRYGFAGARYEIWNEPEDNVYYFYGYNPDPYGDLTYSTLQDYTLLYAYAARGVRDGDPSALVGGPVTAHWNAGPGGLGFSNWGLPEFLAALAAFNVLYPDAAGPLDMAVWHDYAWIGDGGNQYNPEVSVGADFVRQQLAVHGFPPETELMLTEWAKHSGPEWHAVTLVFEASHTAFNLIREARRPASEGFARMYWFSFDYRSEGFGKTALTRIYRKPYGIRLRPGHAVFEMLGSMIAGRQIGAAVDSPLEAFATSADDGSVSVAISNHTESRSAVRVSLMGLPLADGPAAGLVRFVDALRSSDGLGLEAGTPVTIDFLSGASSIDLDLLPGSACQVVIGGA